MGDAGCRFGVDGFADSEMWRGTFGIVLRGA